jgi:L-Ala-D/L-Glu epimerase
MNITVQPIDLQLRHPFTLARGTRTSVPSVIVKIEHDGIVGYGEASPSARYSENVETVVKFLRGVDLKQFSDPFQVEAILRFVDQSAEGNTAAKASIDIAIHDWIGKRLEIPLWKLFGLNKETIPLSSFTIGIDSLEVIKQKIDEAKSYPILKVKLGVPNDRTIIKTIREHTDKILRVDANEGWKTKEEALDNICWLEEQRVELVEQPMPASALEQIAWVRERVHIPLYADESVVRSSDISKLASAFDGINIKLMKSTGIREALRIIYTAQALKMKVMLGCMIESSVGISAAAQLAPLADCLDLDGNLLITNDPFHGVTVTNGTLTLSDKPGLGINPRSQTSML